MIPTEYDLVFEGGGARGLAFVGALRAFNEVGFKPKRLLGTSSGAIMCALVGAGYTPDELVTAVSETTNDGSPIFSTFMDAPEYGSFNKAIIDQSVSMQLLIKATQRLPWHQSISYEIINELMKIDLYRESFGFVECGGFYSGFAFSNWLKTKLALKRLNQAITLNDFHLKTGSDISLVASDTTEDEMLVLNYRTAPEVPVVSAVRMSMSIPFIWREIVWLKEWGQYRSRDKENHIIVDGGVLSNFPIALVEEETIESLDIMGGVDQGNVGTIGFLLDGSTDPASATMLNAIETSLPRLRTAQRVLKLLDTMMKTSDNSAIRKYSDKICRIPVKGYGTTEFRMAKEKLNILIGSGYRAMKQYIANYKE